MLPTTKNGEEKPTNRHRAMLMSDRMNTTETIVGIFLMRSVEVLAPPFGLRSKRGKREISCQRILQFLLTLIVCKMLEGFKRDIAAGSLSPT